MALLFPRQGEELALQNIINKTAPQTLVMKLYKSNTTPAATDTESTYTEATFTGYASITLTPATWTTTQADPSHADYPQQTYTSTAGSQSENEYGYYVIQTTSGKLMYAERFTNGPYLIQNNGDNIKITPIITAT